VVVITTRRGQAGANQFSLSTYYGMQTVPKRLSLASNDELVSAYQQAYANANRTGNDRPAHRAQPVGGGRGEHRLAGRGLPHRRDPELQPAGLGRHDRRPTT
jgi:hypothetical protein